MAELCKKLSRAIGMLYKMKNFCNSNTLKSIYYSLFHSHLIYGILVWGLAKPSMTNKVILLQKRAIRIIFKSDYLEHTDPLFKDLEILKCTDQYIVTLSGMLWDYDHKKLPSSLSTWFTKISHRYKTRNATKGKLKPCLVKTKKHGMHSFRYEGTQIFNILKDTPLYNNSKTKKCFISNLKKCFIQNY